MSKSIETAVNGNATVNATLASVLGITVQQVEALTPEQMKEARKILANLTKDENKTSAMDSLIQTARNHRAKLENNLFDLKKMGADEATLAEIMQPLDFVQCKTRTMARLKKEAEAKAPEAPAAE